MKVKEGYMLLTRPQNRSRPSILHIIHDNAKERDACLCGAVLLGVNDWNVIEDAGDLRASKRCQAIYDKTMKFKRWKR